MTLVLTHAESRPVLSVTFATVFASIALFALVVLIYATIDQIHPVSIVGTIHNTGRRVCLAQRDWLSQTRPPAVLIGEGEDLASDRNGYLARIDVAELTRLLDARPGATITLPLSIGAGRLRHADRHRQWLRAG